MLSRRSLCLIALLPFLLTFVGAALNLAAITANHGLMPYVANAGWNQVAPGTVTDPRHISWYAGVHLGFLCDWVHWFDGSVWSIGDMFLAVGDWIAEPILFLLAAIFLFDQSE